MKMRRLISAVLAVVMLLSVMPVFAAKVSAAEGEAPGGLFLDKTATLTNDGTYTIDLEAYATGTPVVSTVKEGIPLDIVLVVDHSGSMQTQNYLGSLKTAVANFVKSVADNGEAFNVNHRIAITTFANKGNGTQSGTQEDSDFSYVGKKDPNWGNTGLFKNDGTFENYGSPIYTKVTSRDAISTSAGNGKASKYYVEIETEDGNGEWVQIQYSSNRWYYFSDGSDYGTEIGSTTSLWNNYEVYEYTGSNLNLDNEDYTNAWMNVNDGTGVNPIITNAINSFAANGPTYPAAAMEMAMKALENLPMSGEERNKLVVVFTDGQPGYSSFEADEANRALEAASVIKNAGIDIYTIGLYSTASSNNTNFMNYLSSNYGPVVNMDGELTPVYTEAATVSSPSFGSYDTTATTNYYFREGNAYYQVSVSREYNWSSRRWENYQWYYTDAEGNQQTICTTQNYDNDPKLYTKTAGKGEKLADKYYHTTADMTQLNEIFQTITVDSTTTDTTVALGADAILKDVMASGFKLTDRSVITVKTQPGTYSGNLDAFEITEDKITWDWDEDAVKTVATLNYSKDNTTITQNGYTITVTESDVDTHGCSVDVTGFNYHEKYICNGHPGYRLMVTITGIEADATVKTGSEVYTNHGASGVYEPANSDSDNDGVPGEAQGSFEGPTTYFNAATYVMDYAKTMTVSASDIKLAQLLSADADGYHYFETTKTDLDEGYGKVSVAGDAFTYAPETMKWDGYDTFFFFGSTNDETIKAADANSNGNVWSKISVIPANNVYYEDTFVTNESTGTVGIEFSDGWTVSSVGSNVENPEVGESTNEDAQGGVHGWEDSLADDTGYSDGTAAVGTTGATATFTFTGTGVDIYSRTNMQTGLIMAAIYEGGEATGLALRTLVVDNFAHSGDYYMIPTLSIHEKVLRADGKTQYDENGNMLFEDLVYGTYTVKLTVFAATGDVDFDGVEETRSTYYLDGIRVYNPLGSVLDPVVKEAYGDDELNASFEEVRDILLDANSFSNTDPSAGAVFIDQIVTKNEEGEFEEGAVPGSTTDIGVYEAIGPENEVYLDQNQMIAFAPGEGEKYYVGLKSPTGKPVTVMITAGENVETFTVDHTTDLFYEIAAAEGDIVTIMNTSEDILSITKIKATNPNPEMLTFAMFRSVRREEVLEAADAAYAAANAPEEPELPDVEIENPETQEPENKPGYGGLLDLVVSIIGSLWDWFH